MEFNKEFFMGIAAAIVFVVTSIIGFVLNAKNAKQKNELDEDNTKLQSIIDITGKVKDYMIEAEKFLNYSGTEKRQYVLSRIQTYCSNNNLKYDEPDVDKLIKKEMKTADFINARAQREQASVTAQVQFVQPQITTQPASPDTVIYNPPEN